MAEGGVLDPPACLDVCALYGRSNPALVAQLLGSLGGLDGGSVGVRLAEGLEASGLAAARALAEVHAKVGVENRVSPGGLCRNCLGAGESCFFLCWSCVFVAVACNADVRVGRVHVGGSTPLGLFSRAGES